MKIVRKGLSFVLILAMLISICAPVQVEAASKVKMNKTSYTMYVGQTYTLKMSGTSKKVTWSTSDKKVATVDSKGKVVAKKTGKATITAKVAKKKYTCKVTVKAPKLNATKKSLYTGQTYTLKLTGATVKTFSSNNKKAATVNSKGKITAKKAGTAIITIKDTNGRKYTCKLTVKTPTINATSKKLDIGKTYTLKLTGATAKTFYSSNTKIATVSSKGKVTAKKTGTATITVKDTNGRKYNCKITVNKCSHKKGDWIVSQKETCEKYGTKVRKCTVCKQVIESKTIDPSGHTWGNWKITKEPTEEVAGEETRICDVCGKKERNTLPKKEHEHLFEAQITEPTCAALGYTTYRCACGDYYVSDYVDTVGHSWGEWITIKEPEEGIYGQRERVCSVCNAMECEMISPIEHEHCYDRTEKTPPTCINQGYTTYYCTCGDWYIDDYVDAVDHIWGNWIIVVEPTEDSYGEEERFCQNCDQTESNILPMTGHEHKYNSMSTTPPDCLSSGYTAYYCDCGYTHLDDFVDPLGHIWSEWSVVVEPEEYMDGFKARYCERDNCQERETETLPRLHTHSFKETITPATCMEKGYIAYKCRCGDSYIEKYLDIDANAHVPGKWVVTAKPAFRVEGMKERTCTLCGNIADTEVIPALGSSEDEIYYVTLRDGTKEAVIGHYDREAEAEMFRLVNEYRVANGYPELTIDEYFQEAADKRGYETAHTWDHKRPSGGSASVTYSYTSENLAWTVLDDPEAVLEAWKNSEGHNNNLLYDFAWGGYGYNYTGISCFCKLVDDGTYAYYWVQVFR